MVSKLLLYLFCSRQQSGRALCLPSPSRAPRVHGKFQTPRSRQEEVFRVSHIPSVSLLSRFRRTKQLSAPGQRMRGRVHTGALLPAHLPLHLHMQPCEVGTSFLPEQLPGPCPPTDFLPSSPADKALLSRLLAEPGWLVGREWPRSGQSLAVGPPGERLHSLPEQSSRPRPPPWADHWPQVWPHSSQPPHQTAIRSPGVRCRPGHGDTEGPGCERFVYGCPCTPPTRQTFWVPSHPSHTVPGLVALRGLQWGGVSFLAVFLQRALQSQSPPPKS